MKYRVLTSHVLSGIKDLAVGEISTQFSFGLAFLLTCILNEVGMSNDTLI